MGDDYVGACRKNVHCGHRDGHEGDHWILPSDREILAPLHNHSYHSGDGRCVICGRPASNGREEA